MGIARTGGVASDSSGDIFIAFSTANSGTGEKEGLPSVKMLPNDRVTPFFEATVEATEEAIINALVAANTMTGANDRRVIALPHDRLVSLLRKYNRFAGPGAKDGAKSPVQGKKPNRAKSQGQSQDNVN